MALIALRAFDKADAATARPWFADERADLFAGGVEMLEDELVRASDGVYVATLGKDPVAIVSVLITGRQRALVNPFVVAPEARERGVGRAVLAALHALPAYADHVLSANIDGDNAASIRCFEAAGFVREQRLSDDRSLRLTRAALQRSRRR